MDEGFRFALSHAKWIDVGLMSAVSAPAGTVVELRYAPGVGTRLFGAGPPTSNPTGVLLKDAYPGEVATVRIVGAVTARSLA